MCLKALSKRTKQTTMTYVVTCFLVWPRLVKFSHLLRNGVVSKLKNDDARGAHSIHWSICHCRQNKPRTNKTFAGILSHH